MIAYANHSGSYAPHPAPARIDYAYEPESYGRIFAEILFKPVEPLFEPEIQPLRASLPTGLKKVQRDRLYAEMTAETEERLLKTLSKGNEMRSAEIVGRIGGERSYIYTVLVRLESAGKVKRTGQGMRTKWSLT